jgi:hypothetical protein
MSIETATPSAMLPASAQASAALAILAASLSLARISLMMLLIAGSMVLRSMLPSVLTGTLSFQQHSSFIESFGLICGRMAAFSHRFTQPNSLSGGKPRKPSRRHISTLAAACATALGRNTSGPAR